MIAMTSEDRRVVERLAQMIRRVGGWARIRPHVLKSRGERRPAWSVASNLSAWEIEHLVRWRDEGLPLGQLTRAALDARILADGTASTAGKKL